MAEDLLKELLTSPLEEPSRRERRRAAATDRSGTAITPEGSDEPGSRAELPRVPLLWGMGMAVLGAAIVISGYAVGSEDPAPTTTTATTTTVAAAVEGGSPAGLPQGYVEVGDRLGMRVERILSRADGVYVTITTVVVNSLDPDGTTGWQGGLWTLVLEDGRRISSTDESFDPLARGTVSVRFAQEGFVASDVVAIELNGLAARTTAPFTADTTSPVTLSEDGAVVASLTPDQFGLDAGVAMSLDELLMDTGGAVLTWSLVADVDATAVLAPTLTVTTSDGVQIPVPLHVQSSGFTFFHPSIPGASPSTGDRVAFRLSEGITLPVDEELSVTIEANVTLLSYDPTVVSLPTVDALVSEVNG